MLSKTDLQAALALLASASKEDLVAANISSEKFAEAESTLSDVAKAKKAETAQKKQAASEDKIKLWKPYLLQIAGSLLRAKSHEDFVSAMSELDFSDRPTGSAPDMTAWFTIKGGDVTQGVSLPKKMVNGESNGNGERKAKRPSMEPITSFSYTDSNGEWVTVDSSPGAATKALAYRIGMDVNEPEYSSKSAAVKLRDYIIPAFNGSWEDGTPLGVQRGCPDLDSRVANLDGCKLRINDTTTEDAKLYFLKVGTITQDTNGKYHHN